MGSQGKPPIAPGEIFTPIKSSIPVSPVEPLSNPTARLYTHIHPVLLLSVYFVRFNAIVADPVASLTTLLLPISVLQLAYVAICLPPTGTGGSSTATSAASKTWVKRKTDAKKQQADGGIGTKIVVSREEFPLDIELLAFGGNMAQTEARSQLHQFTTLTNLDVKQPATLSLILAGLVGTPLLFGLLVLFGAPITTHHMHTILAAAHLSLLSAIPLVYAHGVSADAWRQVAGLLLPVDEVMGASLGTCVGAWLGAIPIPLDW